jgi:5-oxoprolinase (ATP-hydrolysing)
VVRIGADVGGTFTDVVLQRDDGRVSFLKVLSSPPNYDQAVIGALRSLVSSGADEEPVTLGEVVHGTTVATNAVLEGRGCRTALVTTAGFRDVLELRRVRTPHHYDYFWNKPPPLVERHLRFEIDERMTAGGEVLSPFDEEEARGLARRLAEAEVEAVAVCLLHSHKHPAHEERLGRILREELPHASISLSSEILREQQEYERSAATAVNAYVQPLMSRYLDEIQSAITEISSAAPLMIMQSSGGLMNADAASARPVYALESGPAAGVIAAAAMAERLGCLNAISFDMGGTTAKASLIENGEVSLSREYEVGGAMSAGGRLLRGSGELIRVPSIDIVEVGAGGGSIAFVDGAGALQVGPRSAGADPGPVCYGRGGSEPTVTDANVVLGYIPGGQLAGGDLSVSRELAADAIGGVADALGIPQGEAARGVHRLANARMMRALRSVSTEKGRDPREFALIAYGGSGPIHAAMLADELGITTVIVPPVAGLFSSVGLLFARVEFHDVRFCRLDARHGDLALIQGHLDDMRAALLGAIGDRDAIVWTHSADVRYAGQSWDIEVKLAGSSVNAAALEALVAAFEAEHEQTYGVRLENEAPVEIRALRVAAQARGAGRTARVDIGASEHLRSDLRTADFGPPLGVVSVEVTARHRIGAEPTRGPLLIDEYDTTVVVPPGWSVRRDADTECLLLERDAADASAAAEQAAADTPRAITQQVVANALATVADEMAATIFRTAHSTVVRDALDYSTALCGPTGDTIAQAVTIPFHLGSVPGAMATLLARYGDSFEDGDIYIMNDPFDGGIHTSDIFVVKPVYGPDGLIAFVVTVAHHGDVGGRLPGTTATDNTDIFQEGLRIPWVKLYSRGRPIPEMFRLIESNVRIPRMTAGDLSAQVAACTVGSRGMLDLARRYGTAELHSLFEALIAHSEALVRSEIETWPDGTVTSIDYMDSNGLELVPVAIKVTLTVKGSEVIVDLSESAPMVPGSLNAPRPFAQASVYQPIIAALTTDVPLTAGAFKPITVITKPGTVTHVVMPAASSMRGVTGFRILDAVNAALAQLIPSRVAAAGEGGNSLVILSSPPLREEQFIFYELVVGTWGARPSADGNDGLSNPSATAANIPIEVAEADFPIIVERYGLVPDSGGAGLYRGGLAIEREWRMLVPDTALQVRSDRHVHPPYGLAGGASGAPSLTRLTFQDGRVETLAPMISTVIGEGQRLYHRTAGGGGWGDPLDRDPDAVAADVLNEKISPAAAREQYGVAVTPEGLDRAATHDLRWAQRNDRRSKVNR